MTTSPDSAPAKQLRDCLDARLLIVTGKGGVGKTTLAASLALAAASLGKRVLLATCNVRQDQISPLLGTPPLTPENRPLLPGIEGVNIVPERAMEEYGLMVLKSRTLYRAVFENRWIQAFLRGTPGLFAWAILGKAAYHAIQETDGRPRYDLVIVDAPATGHALELLRVPNVILDVAPPGILRRDAERTKRLLTDAKRARVILVTLPEELPVQETLELRESIVTETGMAIGQTVVNRVAARRVSDPPVSNWLAAPGASAPSPALAGWMQAAQRRQSREQEQAFHIQNLAHALGTTPLELPELRAAAFNRNALEALNHAWLPPQ